MSDTIRVEMNDGRFQRHSLISWWEQDRIQRARVLLLGVGALGNEIVKNLALLGFRDLTIVDLDHVELSNLSRSVLFREEDEGRAKVEAAASGAVRIHSEMRVTPMKADLVYDLGLGHYLDADLVCAGLDSREARLAVNAACIRTGRIFFDGAMEAISGVARSFDGRRGACYECTMSEADWSLIRHRRSCNMLNREEMLQGRVPTTATIGSVVAGLLVQQMVLELHDLCPGHGRGLMVNGPGFDAWGVEYTRRDDCFAHDAAEEIRRINRSARHWTVGEALVEFEEDLGGPVTLDLRHDLMDRRTCPACSFHDEPLQPLGRLGAGAASCPECGEPLDWTSVASIDGSSPLVGRLLHDVGVADYDIIRLRRHQRTIDLVLDGDRPAAPGRDDGALA